MDKLRILLTGATGFVGNAILLDIKSRVEAGEISNIKLFLPIRSKNRISGEKRCDELTRKLGLLVHGITVIWIDPMKGTNSWPREINSVLLCAFDTNFNRPLNEMFLNSVYPIIETLRAISEDTSKKSDNRWPYLKKIVLVSTAFVQPPLPFLRYSSGSIKEWAPLEAWNNDPVFLYNNLTELASKNEDITTVQTNVFMKKLPKLHEHARVNTYIFCKTFVEAMIEYDPKLRGIGKIICIVRPSIIGASMDGTQYNVKSPGCSSMLLASNQLFGRAVKWTGSLDIVPICKVAHVIVDASRISDSNPDFDKSKEQNNYIHQGTVEKKYSQIAKIQYITNGFSFSSVVLNASCGKWFSIAFPERLIPFIQMLECVLASLIFFTSKAGKRLSQVYHSYDYLSSQTFDFPTVIGLDVPSHILKCTQNKSKPIDPKFCATHWMQRYNQDRDDSIMSIVAFMVFNVSLVGIWCHHIQKFATDNGTSIFDLATVQSYFQSVITPTLIQLVPYSGYLYVSVILFSFCVRYIFTTFSNGTSTAKSNIMIGTVIQRAHNLNMSFQSCILLYFTLDAMKCRGINPFDDTKYSYQNLHLLLGTFLISKMFEWIDTIILILNGKQLLLLHLVHHGTIFWGFYHGFWSATVSWIAFWNSMIHIVMYLYYARLSFLNLKELAKYITTAQMIHLAGGVILSFMTALGSFHFGPFKVDPVLFLGNESYNRERKAFQVGILIFSYCFLFLAFYSRRYTKSKNNGVVSNGSVWLMLGGERLHAFVSEMQDRIFPRQNTNVEGVLKGAMHKLEIYFASQGLLTSPTTKW